MNNGSRTLERVAGARWVELQTGYHRVHAKLSYDRASQYGTRPECCSVHGYSLNQNRIFVRMRSRHAIYRCNFKEKLLPPKFIPQIHTAISDTATMFAGLKADIDELYVLFARLDSLTTPKAKSNPGLEIVVQIVTTCQHVHARRILYQVLAGSCRLDPGSRTNTVNTVIVVISQYPDFFYKRHGSGCLTQP